MSVSVSGPDRDAAALRELVREVLRDALPQVRAAAASPAGTGAAQPLRLSAPPQESAGPTLPPAPAPSPTAAAPNAGDPDVVDLRTDADLDAFVRRLLALSDNPKHRADILAGRRRFRLAPADGTSSPVPAHRVERGAVTEAQVKRAAAAGARLVLGSRAVMTPLARDRARALGVVVDKER